MIDYRRINSSWLSTEVGTKTLARGSQYFRVGRATLVEAKYTVAGRLLLLGTCDGSGWRPYRQQVQIVDDEGALELSGDCSCPVGYNCKHVAALVLTWLSEARRAGVTRDPLSEWLAELEGAEEPDDDAAESLLYLLQLNEPPLPTVTLDLRVARRRRDRAWTKGRTAHLSSMSSYNYRGNYLRPADFEVVGFLELCNRGNWGSEVILADAAGRFALNQMIATDRAYLGDDRRGPLQPGSDRLVTISWTETEQGYRPMFEIDGEARLALDVSPPCYVDEERLEVGGLVLPKDLTDKQLKWLQRAPAIDAARIGDVSRRLAIGAPGLPSPTPVAFTEIDAPPVPSLAVTFDPAAPHLARAQLSYLYGDLPVSPGDDRAIVTAEVGEKLVRVRRDPEAEGRAHHQLVASGLASAGEDSFTATRGENAASLRHVWLDWWEREAPRLRAQGWRISGAETTSFALSQATEIAGDVDDSSNDWFSLRFDLEVDGERLPLLPLVAELIEHYQPAQLPETIYLDTGEGHYVSLRSNLLEPVLATILDLYDRDDGDEIRLSRPDVTRLLDLEDLPIRGATSLQRLAHKLADFSGLRTVPLPSTFKGTLRPYQQHGLDWLQFLREHEFNGILADDMGLGKTIQTLAHLAVERRAGRMKHPSLIVAPTSLMSNWRREAEQFTPGLRVLVLHGPDRSAWFERLSEFDVILTTYPLLPRDRTHLLHQRWHYLILDEAQQIKNPKAQAAQVVRKLDCGHRLCLTGTPMENHLGELWAQFDFLMPGFLGDSQSFTRTYRTPIEKHGDGARLQSLNRRTRPFLLRRSKELVASELPPKSELLRTATLGPQQARLYESIRLTMEARVRQAIASRGLARSHIVVLDALLKLRQTCCDPRLLPPGTAGAKGTGSAKFDLLFELLPELLEEGRRVLLFSQFTTMLRLIEQEVIKRRYSYCKLTGQTRNREDAIDRFRTGEVDIFLISLKAGGVGLNLVEADTVIHYDPWWNPAVENQASDRAHRIGQERPVFIYKLVTEGTIEEKILALQQRKQALADATYGQGRAKDQPPIDEQTIQELFGAV